MNEADEITGISNHLLWIEYSSALVPGRSTKHQSKNKAKTDRGTIVVFYIVLHYYFHLLVLQKIIINGRHTSKTQNFTKSCKVLHLMQINVVPDLTKSKQHISPGTM